MSPDTWKQIADAVQAPRPVKLRIELGAWRNWTEELYDEVVQLRATIENTRAATRNVREALDRVLKK